MTEDYEDIQESEFRMKWLENNFTIDQVLGMLEGCDKDCKSCEKDQKVDCILELKECLHSMAKMMKNTILAVFEMAFKKQTEDDIPAKVIKKVADELFT